MDLFDDNLSERIAETIHVFCVLFRIQACFHIIGMHHPGAEKERKPPPMCVRSSGAPSRMQH